MISTMPGNPAAQPSAEMLRMLNAFLTVQALHVAALGIADILAAGPKSLDELASGTKGAPMWEYIAARPNLGEAFNGCPHLRRSDEERRLADGIGAVTSECRAERGDRKAPASGGAAMGDQRLLDLSRCGWWELLIHSL